MPEEGESSTSSHLSALRDGIRTVARHPWGYGLGNAGVSAARTGVTPKAGESTYTELGVDAGLLGVAAFVGWLATLFAAIRRRSPWLASSLVAVAVLGLQTDVIGIHWLSVVVFALAGAALVFLSTMKELPATLLLRPIGFDTLATEIWGATQVGAYSKAAVPALLLILLSTPVLWLVHGDRSGLAEPG